MKKTRPTDEDEADSSRLQRLVLRPKHLVKQLEGNYDRPLTAKTIVVVASSLLVSAIANCAKWDLFYIKYNYFYVLRLPVCNRGLDPA